MEKIGTRFLIQLWTTTATAVTTMEKSMKKKVWSAAAAAVEHHAVVCASKEHHRSTSYSNLFSRGLLSLFLIDAFWIWCYWTAYTGGVETMRCS